MRLEVGFLLLDAGDRSTLRYAGTAHEIRMEVRREVAQVLADALVTTQQPVVAHDRRNGDEQANGRHDQRFADGACHLVDGRLTADADADERLEDADDGAEQADERSRRTDG